MYPGREPQTPVELIRQPLLQPILLAVRRLCRSSGAAIFRAQSYIPRLGMIMSLCCGFRRSHAAETFVRILVAVSSVEVTTRSYQPFHRKVDFLLLIMTLFSLSLFRISANTPLLLILFAVFSVTCALPRTYLH